jgi:ComF family protein
MLTKFSSFIHQLKQLAIPPHCIQCGIFYIDPKKFWCVECEQLLRAVVSVQLSITANKQMPVFAVGAYHEPLKQLIIAKSWSHRTASASLGELIWMRTPVSILEFDYIVPVPLHWRRYAWRGYNQAEVIAQKIAAKSGKPVISLIKRVKHSPFQSSLAIDQRAANVADVFALALNDQKFTGARFLLVDDLMTTGATLQRCAQVIIRHTKAEAIYAVVAARAC